MTRFVEATALRAAAERTLKSKGVSSTEHLSDQSLDAHELQVLLIESEMQTEALVDVRAELEASLKRFTQLYDHAPVSYFTIDRNGIIRQLNLAGAHLLGAERDSLVGRHFTDFIRENSLPEFAGLLDRAFVSQHHETCDIALVGGRLPSKPLFVHVEVEVSGVDDTLHAVALDITATTEAENALRESESIFRCVFQNSLDAILITTPEGGILAANAEAQKMFGYSEAELCHCVGAAREGWPISRRTNLPAQGGQKISRGNVVFDISRSVWQPFN